jgi:hypothetical protein
MGAPRFLASPTDRGCARDWINEGVMDGLVEALTSLKVWGE